MYDGGRSADLAPPDCLPDCLPDWLPAAGCVGIIWVESLSSARFLRSLPYSQS
jgi:hypothetical protein